MCLFSRQLNAKTRVRQVIANVSLILGILLSNAERLGWIQHPSPFEHDWLDAIAGFLFGLYIAVALLGMWGARRRCDAEFGRL